MLRLATATVLVAALLAPTAGAQSPGSIVDVSGVVVPERTVGGFAFPVSLTLRNQGGGPIDVELMAALYLPPVPGDSSCGSVEGGRFLRFTHLVQPHLTLAAGETREYPGDSEWRHRYDASDASAGAKAYELCVFAIEARHEERITYLDYEAVPLQARPSNAQPAGDFVFEPAAPGATETVAFTATGSDEDGDPLAYRWDFGFFNASGRAVAQGAEATARFYPQGEYVVTLTVDDGFEPLVVRKTIAVGPEPPAPATLTPTSAPDAGEREEETPVPAWLTLAAAASALLARRGWTRRRG